MKRKDILDLFLPGPLADIVDHAVRARRLLGSPGVPMNGMAIRLDVVNSMITALGVQEIIETGTYLAATTTWFAQFGVTVDSIELNPFYAAAARRKLRSFPAVTIHTGNSTAVLKRLVAAAPDFSGRTFFYLDAHWHDYLPLRDELNLVLQHYQRPLILIDDFAVPHDAGYGFDDYGPGKRIDSDYIAPALTEECQVFFPAIAATRETGSRRGYAILAKDHAAIEHLSNDARLTVFRNEGHALAAA